MIFGKEIIILLFSEKYLPSASVLASLMIGLNLMLVEYTYGFSLVAIGESNKPPIATTVLSIVSLLSNFLLIPKLGIIGAALANIAGLSVTVPLVILFLRRREINVRVEAFLKPLLILGGCWLLMLYLKPDTFLGELAILLVFLLASFGFSVIRKEDLFAVAGEATKFTASLRRSISLRIKA